MLRVALTGRLAAHTALLWLVRLATASSRAADPCAGFSRGARLPGRPDRPLGGARAGVPQSTPTMTLSALIRAWARCPLFSFRRLADCVVITETRSSFFPIRMVTSRRSRPRRPAAPSPGNTEL
jgi:hypothetical protein